MNIEDAMHSILIEAGKNANQVCKIKTADSEFVKGHSVPEEDRSVFVEALNCLISRGSLKRCIGNNNLEIFELTATAWRLLSVDRATELILNELTTSGVVYKIHSENGEFVQCGENAFDQIDEERIVFLRALQRLLYGGKIRIVSDSRQMCRFAPAHDYASPAMPSPSLLPVPAQTDGAFELKEAS